MSTSRFVRLALVLVWVAVVCTPLVVFGFDDAVLADTQADQAIEDYGVSGQGVTVAILDRGIDWSHPDFVKPDGTTRIRWLLDMSGQSLCSSDDPTPVEYNEVDINLALANARRKGVRIGQWRVIRPVRCAKAQAGSKSKKKVSPVWSAVNV